MENCRITLFKAIYAGFMIGIAGTIYLTVPVQWIAALFFSIGLIMICLSDYNLYTGKVGYVKSFTEVPRMITIILGNFIGVFLISLISPVSAASLVTAKLGIPLGLLFFKSMACGFLMYLAVDYYKRCHSILAIICCIPAFILAGFEHSIADMFYICTVKIFNSQVVRFVLITIIGNAIGAIFARKSLQ
jgi:formate/nitrite transporter FocA (FNT family)